MLPDKNIPKRSITAIIFSYLVLSVLTSLLMWIIVSAILSNIESIPKSERDGFQNPYFSFLAFSMLFLFASFLLYNLVVFFIPDEKKFTILKLIIGFVTGAIPVIVGYMVTWGFSSAGIADYITIGLLTLGGASIPFVESKLSIKVS